jgi:hypothetical protein
MSRPGGSAWELAGICREALDQEVYGGMAPSDSNALTEVWPTSAGAAFTMEHDDGTFAVIVVPVDAAKGLVDPDWT